MRPALHLLNDDLVQRILDEGIQLLVDPGVRIHNAEALGLLAEAGAALGTAPGAFDLYDLDGNPRVHYGGDHVQFDPGSAAISLLDAHTQQQRPPLTADFVRFVQLVEMLPAIDAQSTRS